MECDPASAFVEFVSNDIAFIGWFASRYRIRGSISSSRGWMSDPNVSACWNWFQNASSSCAVATTGDEGIDLARCERDGFEHADVRLDLSC